LRYLCNPQTKCQCCENVAKRQCTSLKSSFKIKILIFKIICLVGLPKLVFSRSLSIKGIIYRSGIDILYEENDEITVEIAPEEQERKLLEAQSNCSLLTSNPKKKCKCSMYIHVKEL